MAVGIVNNERRHDPSDHDCKGGVRGDKYPLTDSERIAEWRRRIGPATPPEAQQPIVPPGIDPATGMRYRPGDDPLTPPEAQQPRPNEAARYEAWVQRVADAIHEDCLLEWQAIAVADPTRQVTMHMEDAHYERAHALVRRLGLATERTAAVASVDVERPRRGDMIRGWVPLGDLALALEKEFNRDVDPTGLTPSWWRKRAESIIAALTAPTTSPEHNHGSFGCSEHCPAFDV